MSMRSASGPYQALRRSGTGSAGAAGARPVPGLGEGGHGIGGAGGGGHGVHHLHAGPMRPFHGQRETLDGIAEVHARKGAEGPLAQGIGDREQFGPGIVRHDRRQADIDDVEFGILPSKVPGHLFHQVLGQTVTVPVEAGMLVRHRQLQRSKVDALHPDQGNRAGQHELAAAAIHQMAQEAVRALHVHPDPVLFGTASGHGGQVDQHVHVAAVQPGQVVGVREITGEDGHTFDRRRLAREAQHFVPRMQVGSQGTPDEPARTRNQDCCHPEGIQHDDSEAGTGS